MKKVFKTISKILFILYFTFYIFNSSVSFAEPFYFVVNGRPSNAWGNPSPSIHFRHYGKAAIAWCDGHVEDRTMAAHDGVNAYGVRSAQMKIGWFAPLDNSLFDLQ